MSDIPDGDHLQLRYMTRFGCIGPACEDNCCYGWRVDVDPRAYKKMLAASAFSSPTFRKDLTRYIDVHQPKTKREAVRYTLRHRDDAERSCPLLDAVGGCKLHAHFGHEMLSNVCATYPRKIKRLGDHFEYTATASCPELARELLLRSDAVDRLPLDMDTIDRRVVNTSLDLRDRRPFYRSITSVRAFMVTLLTDVSVSFEQRLFLMTWFCKRTASVLSKSVSGGDLSLVEREMAMVMSPRYRQQILSRFDQLETPAAVVLLLIRAIVRPNPRGIRKAWKTLVDETLASYRVHTPLEGVVSDSEDVADHDAKAADVSTQTMANIGEVWRVYRERRRRLYSRPLIAERLEQYYRNYTVHTWFHHLATEADDIMDYCLRYLVLQACQKFLIQGHPEVHRVMREAIMAIGEGEITAEEADVRVIAALDQVAVSVCYQLSRHIEHGPLIAWFVTALKDSGLLNMAGGVYLIRF